MVAVARRKELQQVSVRLSLPIPKQAARLKPSDPAYEAMAQPNRLLWMNLGDLPLGRSRPPFQWLSEEQLADLRAATLRRAPGRRTV